MSFTLQKPPHVTEGDFNSPAWQRWFLNVYRKLTEAAAGAWGAIDFTGSNITDIATRNHADLQNINTASYTHLTATNHTDLTDGGATTLHKHDHAAQDNLNSTDYTHLTAANHTDLTDGNETTLHKHADEYINMTTIGTPSGGSTLASSRTAVGSSGVIDGTLTYVSVGSTAVKVSVAAGDGYIRLTNDQQGELVMCHWDASPDIYTFSAPAAGQENTIFIGVEYAAGNVTAVTKTAFTDWNWYTNFPLARCSYDGVQLHILNAYAHSEDTANLARKYLRKVFPFRRETSPEGTGGLVAGEIGTRNVTMSAGNLWHGFNNYAFTAINTAVSGTVNLFYRDGSGGFTKVTGGTQWPNTQYDDNTGVLHTMTASKYACLWVYLDCSCGCVEMLYGRGEYVSIPLAQAESAPTLPAHLTYHGRLIARFIFQKSAATLSLNESAWEATFAMNPTSDHTQLSNLAWTSSGHTGTATRVAGFNGSGAAAELTYDSANTASALVQRDGSGNFSAGTITANLTGNASGSSGSCTGNAATATALATARAINGTDFDGTAAITVPVNNTDDTTTAAVMYPLFTATVGGNYAAKTSSTKFKYNPSNGNLTMGGSVTATAFNKVVLTAPATSCTITLLDGKTFTVNNTLTLAGTDGTTMTFPATSSTVVTTATLNGGTLPASFTTLNATSQSRIGAIDIYPNTVAAAGWNRNTSTGAILDTAYDALQIQSLASGSGVVLRHYVGSTGVLGSTITLSSTLAAVSGAFSATSSIKSSGALAGVGYDAGAGGTATQLTSKATGVTIAKACGTITMHNANLAADTTVTFVLTMTGATINSTDQLILSHISVGTFGAYVLNARYASSTTFNIDVHNCTPGDLAEAIVIQYSLFRSVAA